MDGTTPAEPPARFRLLVDLPASRSPYPRRMAIRSQSGAPSSPVNTSSRTATGCGSSLSSCLATLNYVIASAPPPFAVGARRHRLGDPPLRGLPRRPRHAPAARHRRGRDPGGRVRRRRAGRRSCASRSRWRALEARRAGGDRRGDRRPRRVRAAAEPARRCRLSRAGSPCRGSRDRRLLRPNSFGVGHPSRPARSSGVTTWLRLEQLNPDQLEAVLAYEVSRIRSWDVALGELDRRAPPAARSPRRSRGRRQRPVQRRDRLAATTASLNGCRCGRCATRASSAIGPGCGSPVTPASLIRALEKLDADSVEISRVSRATCAVVDRSRSSAPGNRAAATRRSPRSSCSTNGSTCARGLARMEPAARGSGGVKTRLTPAARRRAGPAGSARTPRRDRRAWGSGPRPAGRSAPRGGDVGAGVGVFGHRFVERRSPRRRSRRARRARSAPRYVLEVAEQRHRRFRVVRTGRVVRDTHAHRDRGEAGAVELDVQHSREPGDAFVLRAAQTEVGPRARCSSTNRTRRHPGVRDLRRRRAERHHHLATGPVGDVEQHREECRQWTCGSMPESMTRSAVGPEAAR